jgi:hypothetical protein
MQCPRTWWCFLCLDSTHNWSLWEVLKWTIVGHFGRDQIRTSSQTFNGVSYVAWAPSLPFQVHYPSWDTLNSGTLWALPDSNPKPYIQWRFLCCLGSVFAISSSSIGIIQVVTLWIVGQFGRDHIRTSNHTFNGVSYVAWAPSLPFQVHPLALSKLGHFE